MVDKFVEKFAHETNLKKKRRAFDAEVDEKFLNCIQCTMRADIKDTPQ